MKKQNNSEIEEESQIKGGSILEPYLLRWIKKQSFFSIGSYVLGISGIIIMIDGLFFVPIIKTRYGFDNYSLNTSIILLIGAMVWNNTHIMLFQKRGYKK